MTEPTDAEIDALLRPFYESDDAAEMAKYDDRLTARAVLAKFGTPAFVGVEPYAQHAIWHVRDGDRGWDQYHDSSDPMPLGWDGDAPDEVIDLYTAAQAQAGAVPLTDIRKAALDLYMPPFRHEHGYIRDANHQMVADDARSEGSGLIASRIRGWGRIQYLDKPEQRAAALQDEVAEMVAEALNTYWAAHGIKGGQHEI